MSPAALLSRDGLVAFLNVLLEAERAGARTLAEWLDELDPGAESWAPLRAAQRDEARNCALLIELLIAEGAKPSLATGEFHRRAKALRGWEARLRFLNRGQAWVERSIAETLPRVHDASVKQVLAAMRDSHRANIEVCGCLLDAMQASRPA
ncbi:MAG: hypothetical protein EPO27_02540 [Betaproteobacteria bacterium]|nr:MAG: hypothetical protein EPO27_02540 [Betaproteobacteria bacterium]